MQTVHKVGDAINRGVHRVQENLHTEQQRPDVGAERVENRVQETVQEGMHKVSDTVNQHETIGQKVDRAINSMSNQP